MVKVHKPNHYLGNTGLCLGSGLGRSATTSPQLSLSLLSYSFLSLPLSLFLLLHSLMKKCASLRECVNMNDDGWSETKAVHGGERKNDSGRENKTMLLIRSISVLKQSAYKCSIVLIDN